MDKNSWGRKAHKAGGLIKIQIIVSLDFFQSFV